MSQSAITIRFDKSHLTSIGTRLYSQSLDLLRELVANAYDADATTVFININDNNLTVEDNGLGMNRVGLEQYFTIGSPFKKDNPTSPVYKRVRIGEFGIGKFAVLSLCDRFEVFTKSEKYGATIIFDKNDFEKKSDWEVPIIEHFADDKLKTGTRITLFGLKKPINIYDLERHLTNLFSLNDKNFSIFINGIKLQPHYIAGKRYKIYESTKYGVIKGELILASLALSRELVGVGIRVKGILIKRETFNLENRHSISIRRLTGEIIADFLPITTSRSSFITDSEQYIEFEKIVEKKLKRVINDIEKSVQKYSDTKADRMLSDTLTRIQKALRQNRDIFITGDLPLFTTKKTHKFEIVENSVVSQALASKSKIKTDSGFDPSAKSIIKEALKNLRPRVRRPVKTVLKDDRRIVKKIKLGGSELLVSFAHLGSDEKESFTEGGIIFVNRDHHLYKKVEKDSNLVFYHLLRLITQELIKFTSAKSLDTAFDWQGKLLSDAFLIPKREE